jgi:hypothetical protein
LTEDNEGDTARCRDLAGTGPSIGRPFLERLLLSLIDAHPNPKTANLPYRILHDRERRLRERRFSMRKKTRMRTQANSSLSTRHFSGWPSSMPMTGNCGTFNGEGWREKLGRLDPPAPGLHADLNVNSLEKHLRNPILI